MVMSTSIHAWSKMSLSNRFKETDQGECTLYTTKGLTYNRQNLFSLVTNAELRNGSVRMCNLLNQRQTELPIMTEEELMGITLGPHAVDSAHGYLTDYHEEDVIVLQHRTTRTQPTTVSGISGK